MTQAIEAYRTVTGSDEFKELERLRFLASCNEASALEHARRKEREKLRGVLGKKDAIIADKDSIIADNKAALADKDAEIARLRALLSDLPN